MAEARTDEEEESGLERDEEQVVRRQPRPGPGGDRPNRRKPEHRHSQGPLSSIRAVLKRTTTRSTSVSVCEGPRDRERETDRERDRRRPEITILSAEPLASTSWFPGASGSFPPPPPPATQIWGPTIPPPVQPPPSYEEVIREKSQEQVLLPPPPSSSLPLAASSSCLRTVSTATSATQTDPGLAPPDPQCTAVRRPSRPPRPSFPAPPRPSPVDDIISADASQSSQGPPRTRPLSPLTSASSAQTDQWEPLSAVAPPPSDPSPRVPAERPRPRPRPRPRSKPVQRPTGAAEVKVQTLVKLRDDGLATLAALRGSDITEQEASQGKYLQELLEAFSSDDWGFPEDRRGDSGPSQSESEEEEEEEEEEDMATLKARIEAFQQRQQPPPSDGCHGDGGNAERTAAATRPEPRPRLQGQPAKTAPPAVAPKPKPHCKEFWEDGGSPVPDPERPPSPPPGSPAPKPSSRPRPRPAPRASVGAVAPPRPPSLPGAGPEREDPDPGTTASTDTVKTGSGRPGIPAKPSSLMMSSRRASAPSLGLKPTGSPPPPDLGVKLPTLPAAPPAPTQRRSSPAPPPRPSGVKALPLRPPPIKMLPGRPPPPTINPTSSSVANQTTPSRTSPAPPVSSANQPPSSLQESPAPSAVPANQTQGQRATKKGPPLPPRPKPGHPLYNSMKQDVLVVVDDRGCTPPPPQWVKSVDQSTCLLDIQPELLPGLDSQSKVFSEEFGLSDIQSSLMVQPPKQKDPELSPISGPRCVARCDHDGQEEDELTFSQGDVISLSELIGQDWGRGQIHGRTGIFPLSFTQVLEPLPPPSPMATTKAISLTTDVAILENTEPTSSKDPAITVEEQQEQQEEEEEQEQEEEWARAVFNFPGQVEEDLSFQQGALIRVLQHVDADWRRGRVEDREGLYPVAFTQPCTAQPIPGQQPAGGGVAKALFDFTAESEDELTLKIGDIVRDVESFSEQWIVGVVGGKRGIVPKNYISPL